jgi:hypothetical protein
VLVLKWHCSDLTLRPPPPLPQVLERPVLLRR